MEIQSDYWTTKFVKELISDDKRTAANYRALSEHGIRLPENRNCLRSSKGQGQKLLQSKWFGWLCEKALPNQRKKANGSSLRRQCGKPLEKKSTGRKWIYCSDECRKLWAKNHPPLYKHECMFCGKEFESQTKEQKFCSHDCYIHNRFWRQEDTKEIMKLILAGKRKS